MVKRSYSMDFAIDAEPGCTTMNRMLVKSTACAKKIKAIEGKFHSINQYSSLLFSNGVFFSFAV